MTKMKYKLLNALLALSCFTVLVGQTAYAQESSGSGSESEAGSPETCDDCDDGDNNDTESQETDNSAPDTDITGAGGTNPGEAGFSGYDYSPDYSPSSTSSYGGFQTGSVANSDFGGYANSYSGRSGYAGLSGYSDISGGLSDLGSGVSGYGDYSFARGNLSGVSYQNSSPVSDVNNLKPTNCSFRGDMQVSTKNGYADISAIRQGDYVFARNEITGQTNWQRVERLHKRNHAVTVSLTVVDDSGQSQTIVSNDKHAYFAQIGSANDYRQLNQSSEGHKYHGEQALGQWIDAQQLKAGYRLLGENGQWLIVKTVDVERQPLTAYNLTVAHDHTYFVKARNGKQGVWVHNQGLCEIGQNPASYSRFGTPEPGLQSVAIVPFEHLIARVVNVFRPDSVVSVGVPSIRGGVVSAAKNASKEKSKIPNSSTPNDTISNQRRTREYDSKGNPMRDYDSPHQGNQTNHVHEWEGGVREEPGRPYSPLNR